MSYAVLEKKIESLSAAQQQSVFDYVDFLLSKHKQPKTHRQKRQAGGLTGEFWMSDDFDETPDCFKDYM